MTNQKTDRKARPMARGLIDYFPDALAEVAHVSFVGNLQHNPGEEMHWAREKSKDHADCIIRHMTERGGRDESDGLRHSAKVAWRALAMLQIELEAAEQPTTKYCDALGPYTPKPKTDDHIDLLAADTAYVKDVGTASPRSIREIMGIPPKPAKPRAYIAGPMRGLQDFNFPAFDEAKQKLESNGFDVVSPADIDRRQGLCLKADGTIDSRGHARRDVAEILTCSHMLLLPGWEHSIGATAEFALGRWIEVKFLKCTPLICVAAVTELENDIRHSHKRKV